MVHSIHTERIHFKHIHTCIYVMISQYMHTANTHMTYIHIYIYTYIHIYIYTYIHIYIYTCIHIFSHLHVYTHILYIDIHTPGAYYKCSIYIYMYINQWIPRGLVDLQLWTRQKNCCRWDCNDWGLWITPLKTSSLPLQMDGWNTILLLGFGLFSGANC